MDRRIDAHVARTQFGHIMDRAVEKSERFVVGRRGQPAVVIMSVQDFIRTVAPPPDWLEKAWRGAQRRGLDKLSSADIDTEITAYRREKKSPPSCRGEVIRAVVDTNVCWYRPSYHLLVLQRVRRFNPLPCVRAYRSCTQTPHGAKKMQ